MEEKDYLICIKSFISTHFHHTFNHGGKYQVEWIMGGWTTFKNINGEYFSLTKEEADHNFETITMHRKRLIDSI